jgi:hypothetical protein
MTDPLQRMALRYRRIYDAQEEYDGVGTPAQQAGKFKRSEMVPLIVEQIRRDSSKPDLGEVDLLISLSGFSPETTVMAYEYLQPKRLLVIGTEQAFDGVDFIQQTLRLTAARFEWQCVNPVDPLEIYREIKTAVAKAWSRSDTRPSIIIDITGGKKVMSASAALAASQLDLPMCYVEGEADPWTKQSAPGTEKLISLANPTTLFGDREMDRAEDLLRFGSFGAAHDLFERLAQTSERPAKARFGRDLAYCYKAWCDFDSGRLPERVAVLKKRLVDPGYTPDPAIAEQVRVQLDFLERLHAAPGGPDLTLNFYLMGTHYRSQGRNEFALLLYYRTLEHLLCRHLEKRAPGFACAKPDWPLLSAEVALLKQRYSDLAAKVYQQPAELPYRIGLTDAALLLNVLGDEVMEKLDLAELKSLRHLRGIVEGRNRSMLAHGTANVDAELIGTFEGYVQQLLRRYWSSQLGSRDFFRMIDQLQFVDRI